MKKTILIFISVMILLTINSCQNYTEKELIGMYVNNYSEDMNPIVTFEAPSQIDTLILLENNKFVSQYFGKGEYEVYKTNGYQKISLTYRDGNILAGRELGLRRQGLFNSTVTLLIDFDGHYYYKKIK